jgi:SPW repeat
MFNINARAAEVRVASGINVVLGLLLVALPWLMGYVSTEIGSIVINGVVVGSLIVVCGAIRVFSPLRIAALSGANIALGFWTLISPLVYGYVYGYTLEARQMWSSIFIGLAIVLFGALSGSITLREQQRRLA